VDESPLLLAQVAEPDGEGSRTVVWGGRDSQGNYLPPGNYVAFAYSYNWDDFESFSIALPPVVATPTPSPEPTASPTDQTEPCEDLQALFPSQLLNGIHLSQNLVQPISDPAPMNQDLGDWQKLLKKGKDWVLKQRKDFKNKGVQRNAKTSFPDFSKHELARANLVQIKGNRGSDFDQARAKVAKELFENGYISKQTSSAVEEMESKLGLTWHHNEDLKTMQLVPRGIHEPIKHMGGVVIMKELNNGRLTRSAYNTFISGNY
jgi:hypothetical protein